LFLAQILTTLIQKTNILYLSYDGMTDPLGQSQVLPYLRELSKQGYAFHLISFEKPDRFAQYRDQIQKICDEAGITWHPLSYTKRPPVVSTVFDVSKMRIKAMSLHKKHSFKLVHCRSYLAALVGLRMKRTLGIPFLFDMRGFWADERVDGKIWNLRNRVFRTVYRYFKRKEKDFLSEADHIISLTHNGKEEITTNICPQVSSEKITVIPCCADLNLFNPAKVTSDQLILPREKLGIRSEDKLLGYVGSIGTWYMLNEMLALFKSLKQQDHSWRFLFVTGDDPSYIFDRATSQGIDVKDILIDRCLHSEVPAYISLFDLSVFFILPAYSKKASSPTKQGELMAMGIPLICNDGVGDTALVVNTYKNGVVLQNLNHFPSDLLEQLHASFDKEETMHGAKEFYSLESGVERYGNVYRSLLKVNSEVS
jgi:glycosyltransferase involved in cell wall biosynthesis